MSSHAVNKIAADSVAGGNPELSATIATGLGLLHVLQVYTSSMVTLAVWDWLVCLQMEWKRIWTWNWTLVKFLYVWTRYYGLVCFSLNLWLFNAEISQQSCEKLHYIIAASCMWATLGSESILAVRTYAFLERKRSIGILLGGMLLIETGYLLYVAIAGVHQTPVLVGDKGPCTASDAPGRHVVSGFWLAPVAFDLICTAMTSWKAYELHCLGVKSELVALFIREGLFYFLAVAAVNVLNAAFMFQSNANIQNINCFLALVLSQVLCCRLVLNLRSANHSRSRGETYPNSNSTLKFSNGSKPSPRNVFPLGSMKSGEYTQGDKSYGGVKVQVEVEEDPRDLGGKSGSEWAS
ncbi:hypothetical protein PLICRDRAFT_57201 [Plicaturopsis crispa FD-325 SS-3]|uniref:DUF6533 domain-containing protein n=1 Tax=Plicaturopsis crispa FD-325 SS-3 TaxID=944288 RepID=A0A0C9SYV0_PLICR|nr:hypothetical protein PLICRDRAFT_57201 [Plicaturopsis crispa FD-325 SS-3]